VQLQEKFSMTNISSQSTDDNVVGASDQDALAISRVMITGATGFVGRSVMKSMLNRGLHPVCLVRSKEKLSSQLPGIDRSRYTAVEGTLHDRDALHEAAKQCDAAIHLVGIIIERRLKGQWFGRVHVDGTMNVVNTLQDEGVNRYVHMSALGTRADAVSMYHQTKWLAEEYVRSSDLAWTILRPSLIHGPDGEFMQLMNHFICGSMPPFVPYFGNGQAKLQPVSVKDVAHCLVESLFRPAAINQAFELGGPVVYNWRSFYNACRVLMPSAKHWKPLVSQPVPIANMLATLSAPAMAIAELAVPRVGLFRFDRGQVQMSQEDSACDHTIAEKAFDMKFRSFEDELALYADLIS